MRNIIEIILIVAVLIGSWFIYKEKTKLSSSLEFKNLQEVFLTAEITQLKLTNTKLSKDFGTLQSQLTSTETALMRIRQSFQVKESSREYSQKIKPGNTYSVFFNNLDTESPELARVLIKDMDTVKVTTSNLDISTELLISREGVNQYRVLTYSTLASQSNNRSVKITNPTGDVVVNTGSLTVPRFRLLNWHEGISLGFHTGKELFLTKSLFSYGTVQLVSPGLNLIKPNGYVGLVKLPVYRFLQSKTPMFTNSLLGIGLIPSEQLPVIEFSVNF